VVLPDVLAMQLSLRGAMQMSLPRMSFHIGDYLKDTGHLRAAGHGAYVMLIFHYWATGGLPSDPRQLAAIARMTDLEWQEWQPIIQAFFHDGWKHKRIDKEIAEALAKYEQQVAAGRAGGRAKALANGGNAVADGLAKHKRPYNSATSETLANVYQPITDNQLRKTRARARSDNSVLEEGKNGGGPVRVQIDTPEWRAWQEHLRKTTGAGSPQDKGFGWSFPSLWPPGYEAPP
jgi:uncharacterized protein YdaU (DUF1376 family)